MYCTSSDINKPTKAKKIIIKDTRDKDVWEDLGEVSFVPLISEYD